MPFGNGRWRPPTVGGPEHPRGSEPCAKFLKDSLYYPKQLRGIFPGKLLGYYCLKPKILNPEMSDPKR
ncbi:MAG: hypothetical protein ACRC8Y_17575, partial [Chroococcales cyanobacterium]